MIHQKGLTPDRTQIPNTASRTSKEWHHTPWECQMQICANILLAHTHCSVNDEVSPNYSFAIQMV
jgi:hypothetical protein